MPRDSCGSSHPWRARTGACNASEGSCTASERTVSPPLTGLHAVAKESGFYAHWSGYQAGELLARQRCAELLDEEGMFRDPARRQMA